MKPLTNEPVAIIGMACRFPKASSLADFWTLLSQGQDGIGLVPKDRWDADAMFDENAKALGKTNTRFGGFIDNVDRFDAAFFGISPREATQMDPQQRLLLELAYEAFEDAGLPPAALAESDTSVFVGAMTNDYMRHQLGDSYRRIDVHTGSGAGLCMLANRLSYQFDLRGPSAAVDTACSSSLVAVFNACQSLWTRQSGLAIAAGVNVMLDPAFNVFYAKAGLSAPDGRCKTFSAAADGIGRAEGAGIVVLKRLCDAVADKDPVYAVIRGGAVNHDGRSNGLTQPNRWAQEQLLRCAFEHAGVDQSELDYIELHGTGTLIGDPIEANALSAVLTDGGERKSVCLVGSVKSNIGHLEAAAGIAGLIKLALSVSHGGIPPSLWFDVANPHIAFESMPIRVNTAHVAWPESGGRRLGGISSFGLGGTNAHLVLESAPPVHVESDDAAPATDHWLFLSARSEAALKALAERYVDFLANTPQSNLPRICSTALRRKGVHEFRLSIIGDTSASLIEGLQGFLAGVPDHRIVRGRFRPSHRRIVLAVPELGCIDTKRLSRWLAAAPIARDSWNACRAMLSEYHNVTLPSADALSSHPEVIAIDPSFRAWHFAGQYALLKQMIDSLSSIDFIVADGLGQLAALCAAGAITPSVAARWLDAGLANDFPERELLPQPNYAVPCDFASGRGPLGAIDWSVPNRSWHERLCVRLDSASESTERTRPDVVVVNLGEDDVFEQSLTSDVVVLTALGGRTNEFYRLFAELSLRHQLKWSACADDKGFIRLPSYPWQRESFWLASNRAVEEVEGMTNLPSPPAPSQPKCASGVDAAAAAPANVQEKHAAEVALNGADRSSSEPVNPPDHALLGLRADLPTPSWEGRLSANHLPYLPDHRVQGLMVLPGAAYAELGLAVHHEITKQAQGVIENMEFHKALVIEDSQEPVLRTSYDQKTREYTVYSKRRKGKKWHLHARGELSLIAPAAPPPVNLAELQKRCTEFIDGGTHYNNMQGRGFQYGPYFQGVRKLWLNASGGEVLAWIAGHDRLADDDHRNRLHPTIFDASLQTLLTPLGARGDAELYIPVGIRQLKLHTIPKNGFWCHGKLKQSAQGLAEGDVVLFDEVGNVIAEARGVQARALTKKDKDELKQIDQWLYEFAWEKTAPEDVRRHAGSLLVFMDQGGAGVRLVERLKAEGIDNVIRVLPAETFQRQSDTHFLIDPDSKADVKRVLEAATRSTAVEGIVYLWGLDTPNDEQGLVGTASRILPAVHLIQALTTPASAQQYSKKTPRLFVVTRAAQSVGSDEAVESVAQAPLVALVRVAVNEYPDVRLHAIDIDRDVETLSYLADEIISATSEDELALRGAQRYVHRMVRKPVVELDGQPAVRSKAGPFDGTSTHDAIEPPANAGLPYQPRRNPDAGEVEVALQLAVLDRDVALPHATEAGGAAADFTRAREGFGVVTRVTTELQHIKPGDDVLVHLDGKLGSHVAVPTSSVFRLPRRAASILKANAASIPAFVTAYYALHVVARLQRGERLLIEDVTSSLGLAAIQVARYLGASIYAADARPVHLQCLQSLDVDYLLDGRSLDFADQVIDSTKGRGLDVVLNVWSGEFASKAFSLLAPFGRFVDLSSREKQYLDTRGATLSNRSLTAVDAHQLMMERPEVYGRVLADVCERFAVKDFSAIPVREFAAGDGAAAIEAINAPDQTGAVAIAFPVNQKTLTVPTGPFDVNGTYLITGGLGGFGLKIAAWMVEQGARNLVLVGRRGAQTAEARHAVDTLRQSGARVLPIAADVSQEPDVKRLIAEVAQSMPPLKGVFHAAAVLDDGPIISIDRHQIESVIKPKALGAWHLHRHTLDTKLDYFVLFSSIASLVGGPGQASYAMACIYLDALAHYRRGQDLPAISINWGALGQVGMAARYTDVEKYLSGSGVGMFTPTQAVKLLGRILNSNPVQLGVAMMDWSLWGELYPAWAASPKYGALVVNEQATAAQPADLSLVGALLDLDPEARQTAIGDVLAELLAETLGAARDKIDRAASLLSMGIDSLMAMDFQTAIEKRLGIKVSTLELMKGNSLTQLAQYVALTIGAPTAATVAAGRSNATGNQLHQNRSRDELDLNVAENILAKLNDLTDDEVERLMAELSTQEEVAQ